MPSYDSTAFSLGPGIVKIGPSGATPTIDFGAIQEVSVELTTEQEDVFLGAPRVRVAVLPSQEDVNITLTGIEWNLDNFKRGTGSGTTTGTTYTFGGAEALDTYAIQITHRVLNSGDTFTIRIWDAIPAGNLPITMSDALQTFELAWKAIYVATDWASNSLSAGAHYLQIEQTAAP